MIGALIAFVFLYAAIWYFEKDERRPDPFLIGVVALVPVLIIGLRSLIIMLVAIPDWLRLSFDLAIYPARAATADNEISIRLGENFLLPVAAPGIADRIRSPEDLERAVLIHDLAWRNDWSVWLEANGMDASGTSRGPAHSLYSIAVDRCIAGDGVLMGHSALIGSHLASGALKALFPGREVAWDPLCLNRPVREAEDRRVTDLVSALCQDDRSSS